MANTGSHIPLDEGWIVIDVERALYVHRGVDVILCDRFMPSPATLLIRMTPEQRALALEKMK